MEFVEGETLARVLRQRPGRRAEVHEPGRGEPLAHAQVGRPARRQPAMWPSSASARR
jgi:hypothetical protein